jgi:signal transduction histidine kinase
MNRQHLSLTGVAWMNTGNLLTRASRRALHFASIVTAMGLLAALLLLSAAPEQESYRALDAKLRYVQDISVALSQTLDTAQRRDLDVANEINELGAGFTQIAGSLQVELDAIYNPQGLFTYVRRVLTTGFNAIGEQGSRSNHTLANAEVQGLGSELQRQVAGLTTHLADFAYRQAKIVASTTVVKEQGRELIRDLRERGKATVADELFRAEQQFITRLQRNTLSDLDQAGTVIARLVERNDRLPAQDQNRIVGLGATAANLIELRRTQNKTLQSLTFTVLRNDAERLRQYATADYVFVLSVANEARILLNIYTVLLLAGLGYFGFRLHRSHQDLNRSHDDLELRVQDRTRDLQGALHELQESQVQLVQAEKMSSLGQLVAGVMHEINTPLLYVLNNASVTADLSRDLQQYVEATLPVALAPSADQALDAIRGTRTALGDIDLDEVQANIEDLATLSTDSIEGLNQISELVQSLKDYSRLDRAGEDRFDVREGLQKTLLITRNVLKYGIEVEQDFADVPDIYCAPSKLNQVFTNLITNAAQAMDGKGKLKISTRHQNDWVEVIFEDTGCGIPEEHLSKIMDPFFTTKPVGQGTGLGLSIVHKIVDEHQGQILIDSKPGVGTRIALGFPVRRSERDSKQEHELKSISGDGSTVEAA